MGYSYGRTSSGRYALCCDSCGNTGGVRKRTCRFKVSYHDGMVLPYCYPPALCSPCFAKRGGGKGIHGEDCKNGAAASQAEQDAKAAKLAAGDKQVMAAWGTWFADVPEGMSLVLFRGADKIEDYRLMPEDDYKTGGFLSDYPNTIPATETGAPLVVTA